MSVNKIINKAKEEQEEGPHLDHMMQVRANSTQVKRMDELCAKMGMHRSEFIRFAVEVVLSFVDEERVIK